MNELERIHGIFVELANLVVLRVALAAFVPAAQALEAQMARLVRGEHEIEPLADTGPVPIRGRCPSIPTEALARELLQVIAKFPSLDPSADPRLQRAYATVLRNVTVSFMMSIFRDYPQIVPSVPTS